MVVNTEKSIEAPKADSLSKLKVKKGAASDDDLSFEDRRLKNDLERMVRRVLTGAVDVEEEIASASASGIVSIAPATNPSTMVGKSTLEIRVAALDFILDSLRSSTSTMTAIPKPVKFLRSHFTTLQLFYEDPLKASEREVRVRLASILSVVATTVPSSNRLILHYYLEGLREPLVNWGLEYQRAIARELGAEYLARKYPSTIPSETTENEEGEKTESKSKSSTSMEDEDSDLEAEATQAETEADLSELIPICEELLRTYFQTSNETEAVDLAIEMECAEKLLPLITPLTVQRVCRYLLACHPYASSLEDRASIVHTAYRGFLTHGFFVPALYTALLDAPMAEGEISNDDKQHPSRREAFKAAVLEICEAASDPSKAPKISTSGSASNPDAKAQSVTAMDDNDNDDNMTEDTSGNTTGILHQLGYILASRRACFPELEDEYPDVFETACGSHVSSLFRRAAAEFGASAPRLPSTVIRSQADERSSPTTGVARRVTTSGPTVDNSLANLATSIVNGFLNVGFGTEQLFSAEGETASTTPWIFRHKAEHQLAAAASLGFVHLWDVEEGFSALDPLESSTVPGIRAGAALAFGVLSSGITSEMNASVALLGEKLEADQPPEMRLASALGLGISYAGTCNEDVLEMLVPLLLDIDVPIEVVAHSALALGLVFLGSANEDVSGALIQAIFDRVDPAALESATSSSNPGASVVMAQSKALNAESALRMIGVALGLVFTSAGAAVDETLLSLQDVTHPISRYLVVTVSTFAHVASSDVEKIQALMNACGDRLFDEEDELADDLAKDSLNPKKVEPKKGKAKATTTTAATTTTTPATTTDGAAVDTSTATVADIPATDNDGSIATTTDTDATTGTTTVIGDSVIPVPATPTTEEKDGEKTDKTDKVKGAMRYLPQDAAVLGLAAVSLGDDVTAQMTVRLIDHLLQCGALNTRRMVPLALAMLFVSNPYLPIISQVFKLAHDQDEIVSRRACVAMGIIGAGTSNSKVAESLRYLAAYFVNEPSHLFFVQVSQGLLHAGKGLVSLSSRSVLHTETDPLSAGILLAIMHLMMDPCDNFVRQRLHLWTLFAPLVRSKALVTVDHEGEVLPVPMRVGQGVDVVGQPGNPRHITGFQTQTTPVLISHGQASELGTEDYLLAAEDTPLIGVVVLKKNPKAAVNRN